MEEVRRWKTVKKSCGEEQSVGGSICCNYNGSICISISSSYRSNSKKIST